MNELDKSLYKALSFLADNTRAEITVTKERKSTEYEDNVPNTKEDPTEKTLEQFGYIELHKNTKWMITQNGLQQLRDLEQIKYRDRIILWAILAVVLSVFSLLRSFSVI